MTFFSIGAQESCRSNGTMKPLLDSPSPHRAGQTWCAVLLAGERRGGDPLSAHYGVPTKALVEVAGRPMLARVLDTLASHPALGEIRVLSQMGEQLGTLPEFEVFGNDPRIRWLQSVDSIAGSIAASLRWEEPEWPVLVTTADNVLLDHATIDWFMERSGDCDVAVGMVSQMRAAEEDLDGGRTWISFRDGKITGANLFALVTPRAMDALDFWQRLESHRKKPWRLAWEVGPVVLLSFLLRRFSLAEGFRMLSERVAFNARPVQLPYGRAGVDVDKPADLELAEKLLAR